MIKNLLYSLFLHFLLLATIYTSFNLKNSEENKTTEITVSLVSLNGGESSPILKESGNVEEKKEPITKEKIIKENQPKIAKAKKASPKNKTSEEPKKSAPSKAAESIKKTPSESKVQEFKPTEKEDKKQEKPVEKKIEETPKETQSEKQNEIVKKDKDFEAKEKSEQEEETNEKNNSKENNSANLSNSLDNLDLSAREKFNIQLQLRRCYKKAVEETKLSSKEKITVTAKISESGYIDSNIDDITDKERYKNPAENSYKIAIDNAKRALDLCSPLRNLPSDKYYIWKEVVLQFDEEEIKQ